MSDCGVQLQLDSPAAWSSTMSDLFDIVEESEEAYGTAGESCSKIFRGLCAKYRISARCFESLVEDGWDDPSQFRDLSPVWIDHVLALAPNGGQKRNIERMLERVEAGPLDMVVPKAKKAKLTPEATQPSPDISPAASSKPGPRSEAPAVNSDPGPSSATPPTSQVTACLIQGYNVINFCAYFIAITMCIGRMLCIGVHVQPLW